MTECSKKKTTRDLKRRDIFMSRQMNILSAHINEQYKKKMIQETQAKTLQVEQNNFNILSFCLTVCLSLLLSFCLSVCLSLLLSFCLSVCLSLLLSFCLSVCLSLLLSFCLSVCLSLLLSPCLTPPCTSSKRFLSLFSSLRREMIYLSDI